MITSHVILAVGWTLFCALHSVLASSRFKKFASDKLGTQYKFYRLYYTLFAFASFAAILLYQLSINSSKIFIPTNATLVAGIVITLLGLTIMSICIVKYFLQVSGLKDLIENRTNNELMITGIHKIVRHPLYSGTFVFIWGLLVIFPVISLLIANTIITIYTLIGLRFEEKKLEKEFGDAYKTYKQKVPMIIPNW